MGISYALQKFSGYFEIKHVEELSNLKMNSAYFFYKIQGSKFANLSVISNYE